MQTENSLASSCLGIKQLKSESNTVHDLKLLVDSQFTNTYSFHHTQKTPLLAVNQLLAATSEQHDIPEKWISCVDFHFTSSPSSCSSAGHGVIGP